MTDTPNLERNGTAPAATRETATGANSDVKIEADPNLAKGIQGGLDMLQKVFEGIVTAAKNAIGPELLRNAEVGNYLSQVASCLDEAAAAGPGPGRASKTGELSCYLERLGAEIKGSKFESQETTLRQRLEESLQALRHTGADAAWKVAEAAGYFHAAARTVAPAAGNQTRTINLTHG